MDQFPTDITTNILSKLAVKSVFICRSVCKTWCSIIDNHEFINLHIYSFTKTQINDSSSLILLPHRYEELLFIVQDSSSSSSSTQQDCMVKSSQIYVSFSDEDDSTPLPLSLVGFSHGLICFSFSILDYSFYICNPATQEFSSLPDAFAPAMGYTTADIALGFGFSPSTNQFKVVLIFHWKNHKGETNSEVQVYTLGSKSWRNVITVYPDDDAFPISGNSMVCVNGSLHWLTHLNGEYLQYQFRIISFNLALENFTLVQNPQHIHIPDPPIFVQYERTIHYDRIQIGVLGGCLCLTDCCYQPYEFEIWVMKEYNVRESWIKQYVIGKDFMDDVYVRDVHPVIVRMNEDLVLLCDSQFLVSYNPDKDKGIPLEDDELPKCEEEYEDYDHEITTYVAFPYDASLISPKTVCKVDFGFDEENA